jgi:anti-sigma B factor antagonist
VGFDAVVSEDSSGRYVVTVEGDLTFPDTDALVELVTGLVAGSGSADSGSAGSGTVEVVVDVGGLGFLDSSGVRALLQARQATLAKDGSLTVTGAHGVVAEVLRITAVDTLLCAPG